MNVMYVCNNKCYIMKYNNIITVESQLQIMQL